MVCYPKTGLRRWARLARTVMVTLLIAAPWAGAAAAYPERPVRLVVPFPPGGGGDITGRLLAEGMSKALGSTVYVENRPGAMGQIGTTEVAKAAPDGYTLLLGSGGPLTVLPLISKVSFDTLRDFAPVGFVAVSDGVIAVNADFPAQDLPSFIAALKAAPGQYSFASSGTGGPSHLSGELFKRAVDVDITHVPYQGDGPAITDVMAGHVPFIFTVLASALPQIEAGKVRAIATFGQQRSKLLPDVPTMVESGYPQLVSRTWFGLYAPAGTPDPAIETLNAALKQAVSTPEMVRRLAAQGSEPYWSSAAELERSTRAELDKWREVVGPAGLAVQR